MKRIDELFFVHRARSGLFTDYKPGQVAYIGNGMSDNAVVGFVTPRRTTRCSSFAVSPCPLSVKPPYNYPHL